MGKWGIVIYDYYCLAAVGKGEVLTFNVNDSESTVYMYKEYHLLRSGCVRMLYRVRVRIYDF